MRFKHAIQKAILICMIVVSQVGAIYTEAIAFPRIKIKSLKLFSFNKEKAKGNKESLQSQKNIPDKIYEGNSDKSIIGEAWVITPSKTFETTLLSRAVGLYYDGNFYESAAANMEILAEGAKGNNRVTALLYSGLSFAAMGLPSLSQVLFLQAKQENPAVQLPEDTAAPKILKIFVSDKVPDDTFLFTQEQLKTTADVFLEYLKKAHGIYVQIPNVQVISQLDIEEISQIQNTLGAATNSVIYLSDAVTTWRKQLFVLGHEIGHLVDREVEFAGEASREFFCDVFAYSFGKWFGLDFLEFVSVDGYGETKIFSSFKNVLQQKGAYYSFNVLFGKES